jgi:hypothetical protein
MVRNVLFASVLLLSFLLGGCAVMNLLEPPDPEDDAPRDLHDQFHIETHERAVQCGLGERVERTGESRQRPGEQAADHAHVWIMSDTPPRRSATWPRTVETGAARTVSSPV